MHIALNNRDAKALEGLSAVRLGVRPPSLKLVPDGEGIVAATLNLREPLGVEDECHLTTAAGTDLKLVGRVPEAITEGTPVTINIAREDFRVFHPESGASLLFGLVPLSE
jgi:ABC-type sugar transport system ATPase subunit